MLFVIWKIWFSNWVNFQFVTLIWINFVKLVISILQKNHQGFSKGLSYVKTDRPRLHLLALSKAKRTNEKQYDLIFLLYPLEQKLTKPCFDLLTVGKSFENYWQTNNLWFSSLGARIDNPRLGKSMLVQSCIIVSTDTFISIGKF